MRDSAGLNGTIYWTILFCIEYLVRSRLKIVEDFGIFIALCFFFSVGDHNVLSPVFQRSNAQSRPFVGRAVCWVAITDSKR